jgi:undecaprenyl-diphosphatase
VFFVNEGEFEMGSSDFLLRVMADYLISPIVLIGAWAVLATPKERRYQTVARATVAGLVALLFAKTISLLYHGQRPFVALGLAPKAAYLPDPGFPSDHTLLVFLVTFVVWASTKNRWLSAVLFVMSSLVALGRVLALVHTPFDVAGGILCAFLAVVCVYGRRFFSLQR